MNVRFLPFAQKLSADFEYTYVLFIYVFTRAHIMYWIFSASSTKIQNIANCTERETDKPSAREARLDNIGSLAATETMLAIPFPLASVVVW